MATPERDDLETARRIARGDARALEALYARYAEPLFAFIAGRLPSQADAEDAWQETWLSALRALPHFRGDSRLLTWLCGIARHKIADHHRRQGRHPEVAGGSGAEAGAVDVSRLLDEAPLPDEILEREAVRLRVAEALAALPDDYREALVARYANGAAVETVALAIGRSYKATESLLSRAREALRTALSPMGRTECPCPATSRTSQG
jgi:RNA polymerase sigma-70 factor (ECF subfamily)